MKLKGWLTRDADGELYFYENKPQRALDAFWLGSPREVFISLGESYDGFPEITWESDPVGVELEIRKI